MTTTTDNQTTVTENDNQVKPGQMYLDIATRMKQFEQDALTMAKLDPKRPFLIRLDGHKFSTFASSFNKPFDDGLHSIMVQVTKDLMAMQFTDAVLGYTQSDEITLVFPALDTDASQDEEEQGEKQKQNKTIVFGGRILKMATLASSFCTARFTYWCLKMAQDGQTFTKDKTEKYERVMKVLNAGTAHFDARVFNVDNDMDCLNNIKWRSNYDSVRNSRMNLSRKYYSAKQLHKLTARQSMEKLQEEKGVSWELDCPASFKYGSFMKRTKRMVDAVDPRTNEPVQALRSVMEDKSFGIPGFEECYCQLVMCKTWDEVPEDVLNSLLE